MPKLSTNKRRLRALPKHEELKQWLNRYREAAHDTDNLFERLAALQYRAKAARTSKLDGMPHGSGFSEDKTGALVTQIEELKNEGQAALARSQEIYAEIEHAISLISGSRWPDKRAVCRCRYLDRMPWAEVNEVLFGSKEDFDDREESYLRRVHKLHSEALITLEKFVVLPDDEGEKDNTKEATYESV